MAKELPTFQYKTEPFVHQRAYLTRAARLPEFALFWEVGTGKSKAILDNAAYLWDVREINALVVVAPQGVHEQWIDEQVPIHLPMWCKHRAVAVSGSALTRREQNAIADVSALLILAAPWGLMPGKSGKGMRTRSKGELMLSNILATRRTLLDLDESHRIKSPSASRTWAAIRLGGLAKFRRITTGSEIGNGLEDLYPQCKFLNPAIIGKATYTEFKTEYCVTLAEVKPEFQGTPVGNSIVKYKNKDALLARVAKYSMVVERKDCFDMPKAMETIRYVPLTDEQKRLTRNLLTEYLTELADGTVVEAPLAITRLQKLQQIAGGHIQSGGGTWHSVPNNSIDAVQEILAQSRSLKKIVWAQWQPDVIQLHNALGRNSVTYFGGNSNVQNADNLARWKAPNGPQVLVASPAKGGEGLNLQIASTVVYYTLSFSYLQYKQTRGRVERYGQENQVTFHTLIRPGTPDTRLVSALTRKQDVAELMRDPKLFKQWLFELGS